MGRISLPFNLRASIKAYKNEVMGNFDALVNLVNGNLTSDNLFDGSVTSSKLRNGSVTTQHIQASAVTSDKLAGNIPLSKLGNGTVTSSEYETLDGMNANIREEIDRVDQRIDWVDNWQGRFYSVIHAFSNGSSRPSGWTVSNVGNGVWEIRTSLSSNLLPNHLNVQITVHAQEGDQGGNHVYNAHYEVRTIPGQISPILLVYTYKNGVKTSLPFSLLVWTL